MEWRKGGSGESGGSRTDRGIARQGGAYYRDRMTTISLKLPERLLARLEQESRARQTTKSSLVRECLEKQLPDRALPAHLPKLPPANRFTIWRCRS